MKKTDDRYFGCLIKSKQYFSIFKIGVGNFEKGKTASYTPDFSFTNMKSNAKFTIQAKKTRNMNNRIFFSNNDVYLESYRLRNFLYRTHSRLFLVK